MSIIVKKINLVKNRGNLRALVDVSLPCGITLISCRIVQMPGQRAWLSMPQVAWTDASGRQNYRAVVTLPEGLQKDVTEAALAQWQAVINE